jgi:asparagine synthase (glutamine-hydrolysing)
VCGIVGLVGDTAALDRGALEAALHVLAARGPDGVGRASGTLGGRLVEVGVRRLALVDPDERQPVRTPGDGLLVFNGEIYNHADLRMDLEAEGHAVAGRGDAAVLAALLEAEGVPGLARIEGSYAFGYLAGPGGPLLLGRDPLGVRPLAFALLPDGLVFASTITAILATGAVPRRPDLDAIADVLRDGVVPTRRTAIRGIRRVAPGEVLRIDARLGVETETIPAAVAPDVEDEDLDVLEALRVATADRMRSRREVAVFLSGGVDSALVAALAREISEVPAYTLTFPGRSAVDETLRARRTARRLGLVHMEVPCPRDPTPWVLAAADAFDEPFADASAVPTWGLALSAGRAARIALTGTGGDEVFGGYRRYWLLGTGPWLRHVPYFLRAPLSQILDRGLPMGARLLRAASDSQGLYRGLLRLQPLTSVQMLMGPALGGVGEPEPRTGPTTPQEAMAEDFVSYLPDDLLVKEDRALMAHGIEGRHPFLDRRVMRAAKSVEIRGGVRRGHQKQVLRAFVKEVIDPDLARVPKRGFAFPVDGLYRGPLRELAEDVFGSRSMRERGFVTPHGAMRVLRDHLRSIRNCGPALHALVMLELWARRVLDQP